MKTKMIAVLIVSVMVILGITGNRMAAAQATKSFKKLLEQRIKEKKQKQAVDKVAKQKEKKKTKEQLRQEATCNLIRKALSNYFKVWESVASELDAELDFDVGNPPDDIQRNVGKKEFINHKYETCSFYFIDQILWDRHISRKAYFKFKNIDYDPKISDKSKIGDNSEYYYFTIFSTYYNPKITVPEVKSQWVPLYNRRHISQKTIVSLLNPQKLDKFKEDVKLFLIKSIATLLD